MHEAARGTEKVGRIGSVPARTRPAGIWAGNSWSQSGKTGAVSAVEV